MMDAKTLVIVAAIALHAAAVTKPAKIIAFAPLFVACAILFSAKEAQGDE